MDISHEEFVTILKEKDKYEKMKENLRSENEEYKIMRLSSIKYNWAFCFIKKIFFLCIIKKWNIIEYFVLLKKIFFSGYNIESEILLSILCY